MPVPIHHLIQDHAPVVGIAPTATLLEALAVMIENDFSQLPVIENGRPAGHPASFVTGNSIARALRFFGTTLDQLHVRDALVNARTLSADEDLFSKMDDLLDSYAALVVHSDGSIAGIVTNYDTTQYFRRRAEDMLLVEDIETTLKDHVRLAYGGQENDPTGPLQMAINSLGGPMDTVKENCRKAFRRFCQERKIEISPSDEAESIDRHFERRGERGFEDLTLSDYIQLARRPQAWAVLGPVFGIPDRAFLEMLEGVRRTRNKLMHFRPDIGPVERDQLRFCADWFKNHPAAPPEDEEGGSTQPGKPTPPDTDPASTIPVEYLEDSSTEDAGTPDTAALDSKYAPLAAFLAQQPRSLERLALTFSEIEAIIGAELPASARDHRSWWANNATTHVQAEQWLKVNWRVVSINVSLERVIFARARDREQAYIRFFSKVQSRLAEVPGFPLHRASSLGQNWLPLVSYPGGRSLVLSFARGHRLRLECYIDTGNAGENIAAFEALLGERPRIEAAVGLPLEWESLPGRRACRVALYAPGAISDDPEHLDSLVDWAVHFAPRFDEAMRRRLPLDGTGEIS
jgi:CBS domain-containing protein